MKYTLKDHKILIVIHVLLTTATGPALPLSYAEIYWAFGFIVLAIVLREVIPPAHLYVLQN